MIRLSELIEAVLNAVATAKTKANLFGAQMAADFSDHELLRHLPIPNYNVDRAEISLSFSVADVSADHRKDGRELIDLSELSAAATAVSSALPEQEELKEGFSPYDDQVEHWNREIVPVIAGRFAADAAEAFSIDGMSTLYGCKHGTSAVGERAGKEISRPTRRASRGSGPRKRR